MDSLSAVLAASVVSGLGGSLCLNSPMYFSGLLGLYLLFKISQTAPILSNLHSLFLDNESPPEFGPRRQQQEGTVVGWELG